MVRISRVEDVAAFDERPELAMGFHFAVPRGRVHQIQPQDAFIVFNGTIGVRIGDLLDANEPLPANALRQDYVAGEETEGFPLGDVQEWRGFETVDLYPCDDVDLLARALYLPEWSRQRFMRRGEVHGSPPFRGQTRAGQAFVRFSCFALDRRITRHGGLLPGSFATSKLDGETVHTALTAVGHYALPSIAPPVYRFEIVPPPLTDLYYGTVSPAFGQSGGGTEIEFFRGVPDGAVSGPLMMPYM